MNQKKKKKKKVLTAATQKMQTDECVVHFAREEKKNKIKHVCTCIICIYTGILIDVHKRRVHRTL